MKKKRWLGRIAAALLCLLLCAACLPAAMAADLSALGSCTLTLNFTPDGIPAAGTSFRIYRVGDIVTENGGGYRFTDAYHYPIGGDGVDWLTRAGTLAGYVLRDQHTPDRTGVIGANGKLTFEDLPQGLYLVLGSRFNTDGYYYDPVPYLAAVPYLDGATWQTVLESVVKPSGGPIPPNPEFPEEQEFRVVKVWADDGNETDRPQEITVDLLRDGQVYDTVTLGGGNSWRYGWTGLDAGSVWQAVERTGEGYAVGVTRTGNTFVVTNTYGGDTDIFDEDPPLDRGPENPEEEPEEDIMDEDPPLANLPQTGQLWWPVPILGGAGLFLLLLGCMRHRRWSDEK